MHMPFHNVERKAGGDIPGAHCPIFAGACKNSAIRTEGHRPDKTGMATQDFEALTCIGVPEANGLIFATAGQNVTIRTEGNRPYPILVSRIGKEGCNGVCMP